MKIKKRLFALVCFEVIGGPGEDVFSTMMWMEQPRNLKNNYNNELNYCQLFHSLGDK